MTSKSPGRRTQQQRRAATEAKLIDATISSLIEVGYYRTTVKRICSRAGISEGGLFGRFDTRVDLIIAAVSEIGRRQVAELTERFGARDPSMEPSEAVVRALLDVARQPAFGVWLELVATSRTDADLRQKLVPVLLHRYSTIVKLIHSFDVAPGLPRAELDRRVLRLVNALNGETIALVLVPDEAFSTSFLEDQIRLFRG